MIDLFDVLPVLELLGHSPLKTFLFVGVGGLLHWFRVSREFNKGLSELSRPVLVYSEHDDCYITNLNTAVHQRAYVVCG